MTSYFEKLTSINASSLSLHNKLLKDSNLKSTGGAGCTDLTSALDRIEELRRLNNKLELDLKCEHDEKSDLVGLKVGLENEVLNLREVNERLEFQVEQLRVEKDKIHHVLAKVREEGGEGKGLFIASSGSGGAGFGVMKKFPSLDDLSSSSTTSPSFCSPSTSPTPCGGSGQGTTPTSIGGPLERITEEDESLLESLVLSNKNNEPAAQSAASSSNNFVAHQNSSVEDLFKKISFLESENTRLMRKKFVCSKCKRRSANGRKNPGLIFEDEGLVLSAVDDDEEDEEDEEDNDEGEVDDGFDERSGAAGGRRQASTPSTPSKLKPSLMKTEANAILEMQRKIIEKLERELDNILGDDDRVKSAELERMKKELETKMKGIVWIAMKRQEDDDDGLC